MKNLKIKIFIILSLSILGLWANPASGADSLTVATWNIRYDNPKDGKNKWKNRKDLVMVFILTLQPDLLAVQEALPGQLDYLKPILAPTFAYKGAGRDDGDSQGEHCGFFYKTDRLELMDFSVKWLSETPEIPSVSWDASMERIAVWALFKDRQNNKQFHALNTHFDHRGKVARIKSAEYLANWVYLLGFENHPILLMGDFNDDPESEMYQRINGFIPDTRTTAKKVSGPPGTFHGFEADHPLDKAIDFVFAKGFKVEHHFTTAPLKKPPFRSDHLPVGAVLKWKSMR